MLEGMVLRAAWDGDLGEVTRLVQYAPQLVNARPVLGLCWWNRTPLMQASLLGHVDVAR
jgi:hypothetical protein